MNLKSGEPHEFTISGLTPETRYYHRFHSRKGGAGDIGHSQEYSFITARPPGSPFTFTLQADSHLEPGTAPEVYQQSLINSLAAKPDFHIVLGDTFMTDKYEDFKDSAPQYLAQCYYFGLVGHSAPVFLVLGNQDGEKVDKRGGAEAAKYFGWGGRNLDGIIYQEFPQPSSARVSLRSAEEYGYKSGTLLPTPGVLRIDAGPAAATLSFIGSKPGADHPAPVMDH